MRRAPSNRSPEAGTYGPSDERLARSLASEAGAALLELRRKAFANGVDEKALMEEGDRLSNELLLGGLAAQAAAGDAILSEESKDSSARLQSSRVWIIDPLDGTREFAVEGRTDWAVHVSLAVDGYPRVGAVALPALGKVLSTDHVPDIAPRTDSDIEMLVSRTRPPDLASWLAREFGWKLLSMGSAGAKAMAVLRGEADLYLHAGGQYEWDSCAPAAVVLAAGFHASRLDGSALRYNQPDPYLPDILVCRPELSELALTAVASYRPARTQGQCE